MAIEKITIENFLKLAKEHPVLDARSPGEFMHAHIPNAFSFPLFTDEERKIVGTAYKQQSREAAIKIGLDFFGVKMRKMVEEVEALVASCQLSVDRKYNAATAIGQLSTVNVVLIHCWRGGMRSAAVAWLLSMYGFKVYTLAGGYKAFRNWALKQFDKEYNLKILGGYTGSGKTLLLQEMEQKNIPIINLEKLANHKGSAFGAIGENPQPSQEMFENLLALKLLAEVSPTGGNLEGAVWLEDESQRIGRLIIPNSFWEKMRNSPICFIDIPFDERLNYLVSTYGNFEKDMLLNAIERIQKRLGGLETKNAVNFLLNDNIRECFSILLKYYDKVYTKGLHNRKNYEQLLNIMPCPSVNTDINIDMVLSHQQI